MRTKIAVLALAVTTTALSIATSGTAHAADTAYNVTTQFLTDNPATWMEDSEVSRGISLAAGTYGWYPYVSPAAVPLAGQCGGREIYLGAGWYVWTDHLYPRTSTTGPTGFYAQSLTLDPRELGWESVTYWCDWRVPSPGTYTWGSALDPHF